MNVYAYVSILEVALKLLIVFLLKWITYDKLQLYGILYFSVVFVIAAIYRIYTRRNFEESKFLLVKDKKLFKTLISYSGWSLFGNIASVAKGQGVNILLNLYFGPTVNAARGIAMQVQGAVNGFIYNFQLAVNPQIVKSYATGDKEYLNSLILRSSKFSFYLLIIISLPIILEVDQLLKFWLKIVPEYSSIFTILVLIVIMFDFVGGSLVAAVQATGKIKAYQILIGTLLVSILPLSYLFLEHGFSPEITLYINVVISIIALAFRLYFVWRLIEFPVKIFLREVIFKNSIIVPLSLSLPLIIRNSLDQNILRLIIVILTSFICNLLFIYVIGLNRSEKTFVLKMFNKILRKNE